MWDVFGGVVLVNAPQESSCFTSWTPSPGFLGKAKSTLTVHVFAISASGSSSPIARVGHDRQDIAFRRALAVVLQMCACEQPVEGSMYALSLGSRSHYLRARPPLVVGAQARYILWDPPELPGWRPSSATYVGLLGEKAQADFPRLCLPTTSNVQVIPAVKVGVPCPSPNSDRVLLLPDASQPFSAAFSLATRCVTAAPRAMRLRTEKSKPPDPAGTSRPRRQGSLSLPSPIGVRGARARQQCQRSRA